MTRRRWAMAVLGLVLLAWSLGGEWVSIHARVPENHLIDALGGLSFLGAGLIAVDRRPGNRIGWLMIAYGVVWYFGNWGNLQVTIMPMLGVSVGQQLGGPLLTQMLLSYPTGRLRTRFERLAVGASWALAIGVSLVIALTFDPHADGCPCPAEPAPFPSKAAVDTATLVAQRAGIVTLLLVLAALWLRWRRATPAERRGLAVLWAGACVYIAIGLLGTFTSPDPVAQPFAYLVWELESVLQILMPVVFVWGLLSARLARSAVGELVLELDGPLPPGDLRAALARALADPSLEVLYAREGQAGWVATDGQPAAPPEPGGPGQSRTVTVVERDGQPLAALIHDPALDTGLVRAAAAATGMAIENERLQAEVRAQLAEVRASRSRIVAAGDAERRRVERNLHDGAQQRMVTLALSLAMLRDRASGDPALAASLDAAAAELKQAITELRELARGIHPAILTEEGLVAAVEAIADRSSLPVQVRADFSARLAGPVEATAYFVVAESLANVIKHACASEALIELSLCPGTLRVAVTDDGIGGADPAAGSGLRGMADRVAAAGGSLQVEAPQSGGTRVRAEVPCDA